MGENAGRKDKMSTSVTSVTFVTFVLWGRKEGEPEWDEQVIYESQTIDDLEKARQWAMTQGFVHFRVSKMDLSTPPDFIGAINI